VVIVITDYVEIIVTHTPTALNTEEDVVSIETTSPILLQGFSSTEDMLDEHSVLIREYISWESPAVWRRLTSRVIRGKQEEPLWLLRLLWAPRGYRLTITQLAGSIIGFNYYVVRQNIGAV